MQFVTLINGLTALFMAFAMLVTAVAYPETRTVFESSAFIVGTLGGFLAIVSWRSNLRLRAAHGFLLTATVWMTAAIVGAVPLLFWGMSPTDALFEAMSGITTTGSTVLSGLDAMPHGLLLWRAMLQALGGIGFIVTGVALLPILKVGGMQLFRTESSEKGEKELPNAGRFAAATLVAYFTLMFLCAVLYRLGGMSIFDAATHAMTTLSTGGYSNYDASFGHFDSAYLQYVAIAFMFLGALPFAWYLRVALRRKFGSEQVLSLFLFLLGTSLIVSFWLSLRSSMSVEEAFRQVTFNVVSVVTTTGYATTDYTLWGGFAVTVMFLLTAVGGCTGSTSGGAKMMRWIVFFRLTSVEMRRIHYPHAVLVARYERRPIESEVANGVVAFFMWYFGTFFALAVSLSLLGLDFQTAVSGALTTVANVGPGIGPVIGPAGNFASLEDPAKILLLLGMYFGRLEILTVFVLFTRYYWRNI